jgi:benzoyl-CoA reductase/2-hydroxyglutaryl-CoA dehydratase subunit BcrC/BadD/HgdB
VEYFAKNLKGLIKFLEDHLVRKMDWDRLKSLAEEMNTANEYLNEATALFRSRPSPRRGIAALPLNMDIFNKKIMPEKELRRQITEFFRNNGFAS